MPPICDGCEKPENRCECATGGFLVTLNCLNCQKPHKFREDSNEANGIFNVFCSDKPCEDAYAARL